MSNKNSATSNQTSSKANAAQASAVPKDAIPRQRDNIQRMQNVLLIWLDNSIDENNEDCRNSITQLRRVVNDVNTYTDEDQCIQFIKTITNNKVCMIISGGLGQHIVPRVHNMPQVDSIFILCGNKRWHEEWSKEWPKIKGVFSEISSICEALKQAAHQCEQNAISISFLDTNVGDASSKMMDRLDPSFMYTQLLKQILLTIKFEQQHINTFIDYCCEQFADSEEKLADVKQLERQYRDKTPIYWYTCQIFLYPILNLALRLMNANIIVQMGFFISDLHRQIEQLHSEQFSDHSSRKSFTVYHGQGLTKEHFEQLTKTKGGLISFNNFLSTSKKPNSSLGFAHYASTNPDLVGILFIMKIDPSQLTTPYASIHDVSCYHDEDEVLFVMHSIFRIHNIKSMGGNNRLFEVNLTLTSDNDQDLRTINDSIREESFSHCTEWYRLGLVLIKMRQFGKAQEVYEVLLGQTNNESEKAPIYYRLGCVKDNQEKYQEAITFYEQSLAIYQKTLPPNHPNLTTSYNNIGMVYYNMDNYPKALSSHEKALQIRQQSLPPNHPDLAKTYNYIGLVYYNMDNYPKALSSHEKALQIRQQSLSPNHPDLGASYNNIGLVYDSMGNYPKALTSYEKALEIRQQSLSPNHPDLGVSYNNIGLVYNRMGNYPKALSSHEKALEIMQQSLSPNHPDLGASYNNIGVVYQRMGDYQKALSSHEKALQIRQQSLSSNHPNLGASFNNIGSVYWRMGNYSKARPCYERAVENGERSLPLTHPTLKQRKKNLELVKTKL